MKTKKVLEGYNDKDKEIMGMMDEALKKAVLDFSPNFDEHKKWFEEEVKSKKDGGYSDEEITTYLRCVVVFNPSGIYYEITPFCEVEGKARPGRSRSRTDEFLSYSYKKVFNQQGRMLKECIDSLSALRDEKNKQKQVPAPKTPETKENERITAIKTVIQNNEEALVIATEMNLEEQKNIRTRNIKSGELMLTLLEAGFDVAPYNVQTYENDDDYRYSIIEAYRGEIPIQALQNAKNFKEKYPDAVLKVCYRSDDPNLYGVLSNDVVVFLGEW